MAHSDDDGLVLPPRLAPIQVVIIPIYKGEDQKKQIDEKVKDLLPQFKALGIRIKYDDNDNNRPGWKFAEYEMKGVPLRISIGTRDIEKNVVEVVRRDTREKTMVNIDGLANTMHVLLTAIQQSLYSRAEKFREEKITRADTWEEFENLLDNKGGFISAHWDGTADTENKIKELTKATIRCIPLNNEQEPGNCILTGRPSKERVLFARAY
jgi:prolyl-tRNA synthetase